jgi:hypothetical protein
MIEIVFSQYNRNIIKIMESESLISWVRFVQTCNLWDYNFIVSPKL